MLNCSFSIDFITHNKHLGKLPDIYQINISKFQHMRCKQFQKNLYKFNLIKLTHSNIKYIHSNYILNILNIQNKYCLKQTIMMDTRLHKSPHTNNIIRYRKYKYFYPNKYYNFTSKSNSYLLIDNFLRCTEYKYLHLYRQYNY